MTAWMTLIATMMAVCLPAPVQSVAVDQGEISVTGRVVQWAVDSRTSSGKLVSRLEKVLTDETGQTYTLQDPAHLLADDAGDVWDITGRRVGERLLVTRCQRAGAVTQRAKPSLAPDSVASGEQKTLVALLMYADKPKPDLTLDHVREVILTQQASTDAFLRENSYGMISLAPDFVDWTTLPGVSSNYSSGANIFGRLLTDAVRALDPTVNFQNYSRLILVVSHDDAVGICGVGTVGFAQGSTPTDGYFTVSASLIDEDCFQAGVVAHEFGHNLGFWHSASISCLPESLLDPCYSCSDYVLEYGDQGDTMGDPWAFHHFSTVWKRRAGWISDTEVQDVVQSGDYWLPQVQLQSSGPKVLRIPLGLDLGDFCYWIEYRGAQGIFDQQDIVQVRLRSGEIGYLNQASFYDGYELSPQTLRFRGVPWGGSISGRVVTALDGLPVQDAYVLLMDASWMTVKYTTTSDAGDYSFEHLPDGYYYLLVFAWGRNLLDFYYPESTDPYRAEPVDVMNGAAVSGIDFALVSGGIISGRVTCLPDGKPATRTMVTARDERGTSGGAYTDAAGYYSIRSLAGGRYLVTTTNSPDGADQYFPAASSAADAQLVTVIRGAEASGIDLRLPPGGAISGRVLADGSPVSSALVRVTGTPGTAEKVGMADSSGNYRIPGVPSGQYLLAVETTDYVYSYYPDSTTSAGATWVTVRDGSETRDVNCSLMLGGVISGRVFRAGEGEGIPDVTVTAYSNDWKTVSSARTDYSGRYRLSGLDDGEYYLRTENSSLGSKYYPGTHREADARPVSVSRGVERAGIDFGLESGAGIFGHVTKAEDGKPAAGASVTLFSSGWRPIKSVFSDGTGRYLVPGLGPGDYYLSASGAGFNAQYYPGTQRREEATVLTVIAGQDLRDVRLSLKLEATAAVIAPFQARPAAPPSVEALLAHSPGNDGPDRLTLPSDASSRFADVEPGRVFHDPFRGIKIEVVEKEGVGAEARARLRVSMSDLSFSSPQRIDFRLVRIGAAATQKLTLSNTGARAVAIGQARLGGRNPEQFSVLNDACSGSLLGAGETCSVNVAFQPSARHSSLGEFAVLTLPCDDRIRPLASVSLYGIAWGTDLAVTESHSGDFKAGGYGTFQIAVMNLGPDTTAGEIQLTDTLADGLTLTNITASSDWLCSSEGQTVRCVTNKLLPIRGVSTFSLDVSVGEAAPERFVNAVRLSYLEDTNLGNNTATDTVDVRQLSRPRRPRPASGRE